MSLHRFLGKLVYGTTCAVINVGTAVANTAVNLEYAIVSTPYHGPFKSFDRAFKEELRDLNHCARDIKHDFDGLGHHHHKESNNQQQNSQESNSKTDQEASTENSTTSNETNSETINPTNKKIIINEDGTIEAQFMEKKSEEQTNITKKDYAINGAEKIPTPGKIKEILDKYGYQYDIVKGNYPFNIIQIYRNNTIEMYPYESGQLFGNGINIIYTTPDQKSIFPISINNDPDIFERYINVPNYQFSQDDINRICSRLLPNHSLYRNFDMKGMNLDKLPEQDKIKLSTILTALLQTYKPDVNGNLPRFRFINFKSVDRFGLRSDDKVNIPKSFLTNNLASPLITGDSIKVDGDKLWITYSYDKEHPAMFTLSNNN